MQNTLLYFGSFNPIHRGHTSIVRYVVEHNLCDRILMVVSPQSPFKDSSIIISEDHRLRMVEMALIEEKLTEKAEACGIEFELPKPSYTANSLRALAERYPDDKFSILIGEDNLAGFDQWREAEWIKNNYDILIYPRKECVSRVVSPTMTVLTNVVMLDVSSTEIRSAIASSSKDLPKWLHHSVYEYIKKYELWS